MNPEHVEVTGALGWPSAIRVYFLERETMVYGKVDIRIEDGRCVAYGWDDSVERKLSEVECADVIEGLARLVRRCGGSSP